MSLGAAAIAAGLAIFAVSISGGTDSAYGGEETPVSTTTVTGGTTGTPSGGAATRTPGALTPVVTPTTDGGAAGDAETPTSGGGAALPDTGSGGSTSATSDYTWLASLGAVLALAGTGAVALGARRRM
jgi:hypothetical protein